MAGLRTGWMQQLIYELCTDSVCHWRSVSGGISCLSLWDTFNLFYSNLGEARKDMLIQSADDRLMRCS